MSETIPAGTRFRAAAESKDKETVLMWRTGSEIPPDRLDAVWADLLATVLSDCPGARKVSMSILGT